ncbi:FAA hydrolase family protein [Oceanobacillus piezotolerans]|uniref:FAA hydrolase family protein n=1 Tax=Oceanobacillus piezotolerans TaxID=2448030 RepID=A0A498DA41_9BACI|nr:fumarylacetoacetate hydrolase family protein [Oceanobacillus piezotolerans]RLL46614.1 FAA hydrolase family protein [Oceanobacillus piezotolerans]
MKLASYKLKKASGSFRVGFIENEKVIDVQQAYQDALISKGEHDTAYQIEQNLPADPTAFFSLGFHALDKANEAYKYIAGKNLGVERDEVLLGTPIPNPSKIICVGKNYADHAAEMNSDIPEFPVLFAKFSNAIVGPEDALEKPRLTNQLDYEVELGIVIGREASKVKRENAYDYIAGYTIGNDGSARDLQFRTQQWLQGKNADRTTPIGPWIVTKDELTDAANLGIRSFVNGEKRQSSNTSKLIFDVPFLLEYITEIMTLKPGDIILTGTPDGVGAGMNPPQFLQAGDVVTVEIDQIGRMENKVVEK